jgi:hypothetical protein
MSRSATEQQEQKQSKRAQQKNCVHHWRIESPNGRESQGVCKRCGAIRNFSNSTESVMWEQSNTIRSDFGGSGTRSSKLREITLADES